ncbi:MAG TPA: ABC transporter permease [Solirubrobacter sp.]
MTRRVALLIAARDRGIVVLWLAMLVGFSVWAGPHFATWTNATLILGAASITAIFAAGVAFGVLSGALDLSVPGTAALAGVLTAKLAVDGTPVVLALVVGLATGVLVGFANGFAVLRGMNPLVVTIASLSVLTGLAAVAADGVPISGFTQFAFVGTDSLWEIPAPVFVVAIVYLVGWLFLTQHRAGARLLVAGADPVAAQRAGVPSRRYVVLGFVLSGLCAALGGIVAAASITQASPGASPSVLFDALTAVALSGMPLTGGRGSLPRVLVGALLIASIASALAIRGIPPYWTTVATGALLLLALAAERILTRAVTAQLVRVPT